MWGSLDKNNNMVLNYKLISLPLDLINYVIIHELCHSLQFNHSKRFWAEVKSFCPNYKECNNQLKFLSYVLKDE